MKIILPFLFLFSNVSFSTCFDNVVHQFKNLNTSGKVFSIKVKKPLFRKLGYLPYPRNKFGYDNHFQGIQKLPGEGNYVVTGGDIRSKKAELFTIIDYKFHKKVVLDMWPYWHPGGVQLQGTILAIPVEQYKDDKIAKIYFMDFKEPESPKFLKAWINIPETKSGNVFFHQLEDGRYLLGSNDEKELRIYFSKSKDINEGFSKYPDVILAKDNLKDVKNYEVLELASSVNLVNQCDGNLFLIFFFNRGKLSPVINDDHKAWLFTLNLKGPSPSLAFLAEKKFDCKRNCHFSAAVGSFIDERKKLGIVSSPYFRKFLKKDYRVTEFTQKNTQASEESLESQE